MTRAPYAALRSLSIWTSLGTVCAFSVAPSALFGATECYTGSCTATCTPDAPAAVSTLVSGFPGVNDTPIAFVDPADNLRHRFVATQEGVIFVWSGETQALLPVPFLDLTSTGLNKVLYGGERGLLAMAVEPDYRTTGRFYVYYTRVSDGDIVVERYQRSTGNPDVADPASGTVIFRIDHPATNHNGGQLAFGPDGYLYISTGDGGPQCDNGAGVSGDGQSPGTLLGKILRIDVRGVDPTPAANECSLDASNYTVPSDNPYVGQASACNEVWALGMRNPFRFTFDRDTGDLYLGDVGQNEWEEINLIRASTPAPANLGWVCREGCQSSFASSGCSNTGCPADSGSTCEFPRASGFWDPILCHQNAPWVSIMGGYRYRGQQVPVNAGRYFYGDAACGQVWATNDFDETNPAAISSSCWLSGSSNFGFGEDHLGELYIVRGAAHVVNCIHNGQGCYWARWGGLFEDGFETEATSRWSSSVP